MKLEIEGKTALVTAASRGMGKSIATKLSMSGEYNNMFQKRRYIRENCK